MPIVNDTGCCPTIGDTPLTDVTLINPSIIGRINLLVDGIDSINDQIMPDFMARLNDCDGEPLSISSTLATCANLNSVQSSLSTGVSDVSGNLSSVSSSLATKMSKSGDTGTGAYTFNTTSVTTVYPFTLTNSAIYANTDPYGSGAVLLDYPGQNRNQPGLVIRKYVDNASFGNSTQLVLQNLGGSTAISTSRFSSAIELVANNSLTGTASALYNGKAKIEVVSGSTSTSAADRDGFIRFMSRKSTNDGFETELQLNALTAGANALYYGNTIEINPTYTNNGASLNVLNSFQESSLLVQSTSSTPSTSSVYLDLFSNSAGAATVGGKWRLVSNGNDNRFSIRNMSAGNITVMEILDTTALGLTSFYQTDDSTSGRIRLGNATYNMVLAGAANTFTFSSTSTNTYLRTNGTKYVSVIDVQKITPTDGGTVTVVPLNTETRILLNNGAVLSTCTYVLPSTPVGGQKVYFHTRQGSVTTLTFISADGTATIYGAPTTHAAQTTIGYVYDVLANTWYKIQ